MNNICWRIVLFSVISIGVISGNSVNAEWTLVWSDEFEEPGRPDPGKWSYEKGFVRNQESQYYTVNRGENARVENGNLVITARQEKVSNAEFREGSRNNQRRQADFTSASLHTKGKAEWTFGRIEIRAKLPGGRGTWPAAWTLGTNIKQVGWPACGEIDIMEQVGFEPNRIHGHIHTRSFNHVAGTDKGSHVDINQATSEFHTYRIDWFEDRIEFFVDDKPYFTFPRPENVAGGWPFDKPQYLILNLAIGGAWGGRQGIDEAIFPCHYVIDYVRVYQQSSG